MPVRTRHALLHPPQLPQPTPPASAYPGPSIPADNLAYPHGFGQLRDIGLAETAAAAGQLNGTSVPLAVLKHRECRAPRIWAIEMAN